ncbi:MAG: hypothetical protein ACKO5K_12850 [Armatimonadota bacterium]
MNPTPTEPNPGEEPAANPGGESPIAPPNTPTTLADLISNDGPEPMAGEPTVPPPGRSGFGRFLGPLAGGALLLGKLKGVLGALKFLVFLKSGLSLVLFVAVEAFAFGWPSAVVLTVLLMIMSAGRLLALRLQKREASPMIFIPFLGGGAGSKAPSATATGDAFVAIMGPIFGAAAALACLGAYFSTDSRFWLVMASMAFGLNLFQIIPSPALAGGSIAAMISPKLLLPGMGLMLLIAPGSPILWIIALMSLPYAWSMWKVDHRTVPYLAGVTTAERWRYGLGLLVLGLALAAGNRFCDDRLLELRRYLG